jgi:hypothetical protein
MRFLTAASTWPVRADRSALRYCHDEGRSIARRARADNARSCRSDRLPWPKRNQTARLTDPSAPPHHGELRHSCLYPRRRTLKVREFPITTDELKHGFVVHGVCTTKQVRQDPGVDPLTSPRRIGYYDSGDAPLANSLVPAVNVVEVNAAGDIPLIRRADNGNWPSPAER